MAVEVVVANLAHAVLMPPETGWLAVLTGNGTCGFTRYDNPAFGKPFRTLLSRLGDLGHLTLRPSPKRGEASSLAPTESFSALVRDAGISLADFGRLGGEEVVLLARTSVIHRRDERVHHREMIDYLDTAETIAMRQDIRALTGFLAAADIAFIDDGAGPVDPHDRSMRRHFVMAEDDPLSQRFDRGGRLFGGFWQNLKRARRAGIRVDGEPVTVLDYSAMFPRLAYAAVGVQPPADDPYAIPGLEGHRKAVKLAMNTLFFDRSGRRPSWPEAEDPDAEMPPTWTVGRFRAALLARHPALRNSLGAGIGHRLMNTESRIMAGVLMALMAEGIVALPLHDGLMVKMPRAREAGMMMGMIAREITTFELPAA
ncbi:hypothetical protein [Kaistia soli]|uniref:hypothetical protein n=1 Tax=Kaistia soli TaxID=446684 RepID=UPI001114E144|nr:hypothetical protein [Kaistia soli]